MPKTILIVEDNQLSARMFHDLLLACGHQPLLASDGRTAIAAARDHHPDLILLDIQLPDVSGLEMLRWVRQDEALRAIPVVATTAFKLADDGRWLRDSGFDDYLAKPIAYQAFVDTIERLLA